MDTRYLGTNLLAINEVHDNRRRFSTEAAEDAYYKRHTPIPVERSILKIVSVVAAVWVGFVTIGFWLH